MALSAGGLIPMGVVESANWGPLVLIVAIGLAHAYGGFREHPLWKLPVVILVLYVSVAFALMKFMPPDFETWGRSATYTVFVVVFFILAWLFVGEIIREYVEREKKLLTEKEELIKDNGELIAMIEQLKARCADGPGD